MDYNDIKIETERLILREFSVADTSDVLAFGADPQVNKYTGDQQISTLEEARSIIRDVNHKDYQTYGYGRWALIYKPDNKLIGFVGLKYLPEMEVTDIGFRMLPEYWGKGIATEAAKEVIRYGFEKLGLERIIGIALPENIASCKVLEKIGLTFFKVDQYEDDGGNYRWYEITKSDQHCIL